VTDRIELVAASRRLPGELIVDVKESGASSSRVQRTFAPCAQQANHYSFAAQSADIPAHELYVPPKWI
jgi:hypothetical protein